MKPQLQKEKNTLFTVTVFKNKGHHYLTTKKEKKFPNNPILSGNLLKRKSHRKHKHSSVICLFALTAFFRIKKDSIFLEAHPKMVKHQVPYFDLILIHYNGQNLNKKVPLQKQENKQIYHCTQRMKKIILFFMVAQITKTTKFIQISIFTKSKQNTGFHVIVCQ